jgi:hypothetical protein
MATEGPEGTFADENILGGHHGHRMHNFNSSGMDKSSRHNLSITSVVDAATAEFPGLTARL